MTLETEAAQGVTRSVARWLLAGFLATAGVGHFVRTDEFLAQVPPFLPGGTLIVHLSGVAEIALAVGLIALPRWRAAVGWATAGFFVLVFPGNVYQAVAGLGAFGLDTPLARWVRLGFQPLLVVWALWSTGAWSTWKSRRGT